ncbi:MAG: hypothetical protein ACREMA_15650, partial [Longimicrobiales bacterium]
GSSRARGSTTDGCTHHQVPMPHRSILLVLAALIAGACSGTDSPARAAARRDSAGVAIFTLHGEDRAPLAELNGAAGVPLDFGDPNVVFHGVVGAIRLRDNNIAVASRFSSQILFFDSLGKGLRVFGREGGVPLVLFTVDSAGQSSAPIGLFQGQDVYQGTHPVTQQLTNYGPAPFGGWTRFGTHQDRIYVIRSAAQDTRVFSADGALVSIYRSEAPLREVTAADRRRMIEEWVKRSPRQDQWQERRATFEQMPFPAVMPAWRDALIGSDGIIWIEPYSAWDGQRRLYVGYDSTGLAVGRLAIAYNDRILQVGDGQALVLRITAEDTEAVRLERFRF